jgi:hypothetical protein
VRFSVIDSPKDFILGVVVTTLLTTGSLLIGGWLAINAKRDACTKFAEVTDQPTTFIRYGLTESICFAELNGTITAINPNKVNP